MTAPEHANKDHQVQSKNETQTFETEQTLSPTGLSVFRQQNHHRTVRPAQVVQLQRLIGNQGTQRLLKGSDAQIQRAPPANPANVPANYVNAAGAVPDPTTGNNVVQATEVHHTTAGAQPLTNYAAPDGTPVLGYPFLVATNQTNGAGQPYNGVRFHLLNGKTGGPSSSQNLVPTPATANQNGAWTAFEQAVQNQYQASAVHVEVQVMNWFAANAVANNGANANLRANLPFFPQQIQGRLWRWSNNQGAFIPVVGANPVNLNIATLPSAAANTAYLSQASADFLQNTMNLPSALADLLAHPNSQNYLANAQATTAEDGFDTLQDAIGMIGMGDLKTSRAIRQLIRYWSQIQRFLISNAAPIIRIGPAANAALQGRFKPD